MKCRKYLTGTANTMNEQCKGEEESNSIVLVLVGVTLTDDPLLQFCIP